MSESESPSRLSRAKSYRFNKKVGSTSSENIAKTFIFKLKTQAFGGDQSPTLHQTNPDVTNESKTVSQENKQTKRWPLVNKERLAKIIDIQNQDDEDLVIKILTLEPHQRYDEEIIFLQRAFKDLEFYRDLELQVDKESLKKLIRKLQLESHHRKEKVSTDHDAETNFYIVLNGAIDLLPYDGLDRRLRKRLHNVDGHEEGHDRPDTPSRSTPVQHTSAKKLGKGDTFGSMSINKIENKKHAVNFVCRKDTVLAVLKYKDYYGTISEVLSKKYAASVDFMRKIDIFQHWAQNRIAVILQCVEEKTYLRNHVLFREGDKSNLLYFIKEGEVELQKMVEVDKEKESSLNNSFSGKGRVSSPKVKQPKKFKAMRVIPDLAIMGKGDYFGESELLNTKPREYTITVYSQEVTLLSITRERFMGLVRDRTSFESLEEHIKRKKAWREGLLSKLISVQASIAEANGPPPQKEVIHVEGDFDKELNVTDYDFKVKFFNSLNPRKKSPDVNTSAASGEEIEAVKNPLYLERAKKVSSKPNTAIVHFKSSSASPMRLLSPKEFIDKTTPLQFRGLLFSEIAQTEANNPIYDRQKAKLERMFMKKRGQLIPQNLLTTSQKDLSISALESSVTTLPLPSSPLKPKDRAQTRQNQRFSSAMNSPAKVVRTEHEMKRTEESREERGMVKLIQKLGLHRVLDDRSSGSPTRAGAPPTSLGDSPSNFGAMMRQVQEERKMRIVVGKHKSVGLDADYFGGMHIATAGLRSSSKVKRVKIPYRY